MTVTYYCPVCENDDPERCFGASPELYGYSWHCKACDWRGTRAGRDVDYSAGDHTEGPQEREPFTDWPNGQGTYD